MQHVAGKGCKEEAVRRSNRYTQTEKALRCSFQRSIAQELPTSQLQIGVLRKATSLLHVRISEAAHSLEKLKTMLTDRSLEPQKYQSFQRERWLSERWLLAAEELSMVLHRSLMDVPSLSTHPEAIPFVSSNAKSDVNLRRFLEYPWPKASIHRRNYCRHLRNDDAPARNGFSRTHRHNSILPLFLPSQRHRPLATCPTLPPIRIPVPSGSGTPEDTSHSSPSLISSSISDSPSTREATPLPDLMSLPPTTSHSFHVTGTATIWQQDLSFSREEILKDLVVSIPDYVNDLLAEFDSAIPAGPHLPLKRLHTYRTESNDRLPSQSELTSLSSGTDYSIPRLQPTQPQLPPKRRQSVLSETVSSRINSKSGDSQMSRAAWRRSSPPSAFPSTLTRVSTASNSPMERSTSRRTSISLSDLRSVFTGSGSSNGPIATSTPRKSESKHHPEQRSQPATTDEKLLKRLTRRMSFLRRF